MTKSINSKQLDKTYTASNGAGNDTLRQFIKCLTRQFARKRGKDGAGRAEALVCLLSEKGEGAHWTKIADNLHYWFFEDILSDIRYREVINKREEQELKGWIDNGYYPVIYLFNDKKLTKALIDIEDAEFAYTHSLYDSVTEITGSKDQK